MIHYCTYFDANYLTRAVALYRSLRRHSPAFTLWALCLDDEAWQALEALALDGVRAVPLAELEAADPELLAVKGTRSTVEYYFTCSPSLPRHLLRSHPDIGLVTYLDADLLFYASPQSIFEALGDGSVLIVPHRFPPEIRELEAYGVYNVGLLTFRDDESGRAILDHWREQCLEWCFDRIDGDRFADQKYLDAWPGQPGVVVLEDPGAGLAPWNAMAHAVDVTADPATVDGRPLVFYHFQGVRQVGPALWDTRSDVYGVIDPAVRAWLYLGYVRELQAAAALVRSKVRLGSRHGHNRRLPGLHPREVFGRVRAGQVVMSPGRPGIPGLSALRRWRAARP